MRSSTWLALALALSLGCGTDSGVPAGLTLHIMDAAAPGDGGDADDVGGARAPSTCADRDGDGFGEGCAAGVDCDDADPSATDGCYRCALPATDCACPEGAAPVACDVTNDRATNESGTCHLGARRCVGGRWSRCEALRAPAFAVSTVAGCRGNCSPGCQRFVDCMSAGVIPGDCEGLVPGNAAPAVFCPTGSAPGGVRPQ
jgi:hypothetical protein